MAEEFEALLQRAAEDLGLARAEPSGADRGDRPRVMIVDDDAGMRRALADALEETHELLLCPDGMAAVEHITDDVDAVILDIKMAGMDGIQTMAALRERAPDVPVILNTGHPGEYPEEDLMRDGEPFGYVTKGEPKVLLALLKSAVRHHRLVRKAASLNHHLEHLLDEQKAQNALLRQEVRGRYRFDRLIGKSPAIRRVFDLMGKVIESDTTVLLTGETGTGKELVAQAIHHNGPRQSGRFVVQNCGALPDTLLGSELFGHRKGSFTGAVEDKKGLFEAAHKGTIFLDEIGETSPAVQVNLLRVLQDGEIRPLGDTLTRRVDVRVIAATNRDLSEEIKKGRFREDLFYRLNVLTLRLPALRERREDIPLLAQHFLGEIARRTGKTLPGIRPDALDCLTAYAFPGNVRELENEMERAAALAENGAPLTADLLSEPVRRAGLYAPKGGAAPAADAPADGTLKEAVEALEKRMLARALEESGGNRTQAAAALGLSRLGLLKKIRRYGMEE